MKKEYRLKFILQALKRYGYAKVDDIKNIEFEYYFPELPDDIHYTTYEDLFTDSKEYILTLPVKDISISYTLKTMTDESDVLSFTKVKPRIRICLRRIDVKYAKSPFWQKDLLKEEIYTSLLIHHNTVWSGKDYTKALEYFDSYDLLCGTLSKLVGFKIQVREPDESNQDKKHPYYIIEEINKKRA